MRLIDAEDPIRLEEWLEFEKGLGHQLPEAMRQLYLADNGGQPQPSCVHDETHLFPVNAFFSLAEIQQNMDWYEVLPTGFEAGDLLHFAYDPGAGCFALSLREADFGNVYFYVLEEEARLYGTWASFADFLECFVEDRE